MSENDKNVNMSRIVTVLKVVIIVVLVSAFGLFVAHTYYGYQVGNEETIHEQQPEDYIEQNLSESELELESELEPEPEHEPELEPEPEPEPEPELTVAELRKLQIDPTLPMVAITFDDGPAASTSLILDILEEYDAAATFFVIGQQIERHSEVILRAHNMGSEIANHSWSHRGFNNISVDEIWAQLSDTNAAVEAVTGVAPTSMRAPFGRVTSNVRDVSAKLGLPIVHWSVDPSDYRDRYPEEIYYDIVRVVQDRDIILLHDIHRRSADATRLLVPSLLEMGFQLVTVSELMYFSDITPVPGNVYRHAR